MPDASGLPDHQVLQQAADWFATLAGDDVDDGQWRRWRGWLDAHPDHRRAWRYVEQVSQRFDQARRQAGEQDGPRLLERTANHRLTRRRLLAGGAAGLAACMIGAGTPLPDAGRRWASVITAGERSGVGEIRRLTLADGGLLWLNTASAVDIDYDRQYHHHSQLSVFEGAVEIRVAGGTGAVVRAGDQTTFTAGEIAPPLPAETARQAWADGVIVADDIAIGDLIAELARYRHGHLGLDPAIAHLRVIGTYPAHRPDLALAMLENALPVRARRLMPWWVTVGPA